MQTKSNKHSLELLEQIQKVEAPPFLFTRIQQRILNASLSEFSPRLTWTISLSFLLVLIINFAVMTQRVKQTNTNPDLVETFQLMQNNSLYK